MSENKGVRVTHVNLKISADGEIGLLTFSDDAGASASIEATLDGLIWFADQMPQLILDAQGERALGSKSALIPDQSAPQTGIPTHAVTNFLLVGFEQGARVVEFLTHKNEPMRFLLSPETATELSMALAPGGDQLPPDTKAN